MAMQAVFLVTNKGMDLWLIQGRGPARHVAHFRDPEVEAEAVRQAALRVRGHEVHVLADLVEEDFRIEQVARLHGRDHRALVEQRLRREFRETPYRMLCSRLPDTADRRREHLLLSGIIVPEQVDRWLAPLQEAGCGVTGVHSMTQLGLRVLRHLPEAWRKDTRLIATFTRHGGLRLSLFHRGRLRYSRMSVHDAEEIGLQDFLIEELRRCRRFYENLRILERGRELHCMLVTGATHLDASPLQAEGLHLHLLPELRFGRIPVRRAIEGAHGDALLSELLVREPPRLRYASPEQRRESRRRRLMRLAGHAAAASLVASVSYAGQTWIDQSAMQRTLPLLERSRKLLVDQIRELEGATPRYEYPVPVMQSAVELASFLQSRNGMKTLVNLPSLGGVLERHPEFDLEVFAWHHAGGAAVRDDGQQSPISQLFPGDGVEAASREDTFLLLKGKVPFRPLQMAVLDERLHHLVRGLEGLESVREVLVLEHPFDFSASEGVRGVIGASTDQEVAAPLSLLLTWRPS